MRIFSALIALVFCLASCSSQSPYNTAKNNTSLLWEVTGKGLQKPSFIFGTMHLLCAQDAVLSKNLKAVIRNADTVYFEIDIDDMGELLSGSFGGFMKNDTTLHDLYTTVEYNRINNFFQQKHIAIPLAAADKMQPMLISSLVYQSLLPCTEADGMEFSILAEAHENKKEIKGLETAAFQLGLISKIPYKTQAKELLSDIDSVAAMKHEITDMLALYKSGDVEKLLSNAVKEEEFDDKNIQDELLNNRNKNWANKFEAITKSGSVLIAVGAGHLGGEEGLLKLLKQKGYTLRPVEN